MAKRNVASKEMTAVQVMNLARELQVSDDFFEKHLSKIMLEIPYRVSGNLIVGQVIRYLGYEKGRSAQCDQIVDRVIARIQGQ